MQTTRLLFRNKSASEFKKTKLLLAMLIELTFEAGMVASGATLPLVELITAIDLFLIFQILFTLQTV
ncbi:hypothetical protein SERLA73DRAFT_183065 [Serpula lacrymans var. lacrymans S7.3]|uniref:Uncharacterized protein n=1 Tax=Serpula lacrymans var. lacrymans (strain S7.3) TaxID=936435 RepID=F8Q1I7_SERL3|nr:hypothetical protein SERLA73DRAFT_183065 [Serpula lacrymans var. lacrymans S7.3]